MAAASTARVNDLEDRSRRHSFRSIHEMPETFEADHPEVPAEEISQWMADRKSGTLASGVGTVIRIQCTHPEKIIVTLPCLASARFEDRVEVLNCDGRTHTFDPAELVFEQA